MFRAVVALLLLLATLSLGQECQRWVDLTGEERVRAVMNGYGMSEPLARYQAKSEVETTDLRFTTG